MLLRLIASQREATECFPGLTCARVATEMKRSGTRGDVDRVVTDDEKLHGPTFSSALGGEGDEEVPKEERARPSKAQPTEKYG